LLCLLSLTCGGIKSNKYDQIRRLMIHTYGYPLLFTFTNLEKVGLLKRKEVLLLDTSSSSSSPLWTSIRRNLR
jgi:membrane protein YqaA with SNARE-associated domain